MSRARILIVDDDTALLQALPEALSLRMADVDVDTCDSAPAALERIARCDYDAVVTDIKMPGMDGLALLAEIRQIRPALPTLLITGHGEHDLALQALRGGAYDFIQKPIDREYFVASLARAIQMRGLSRQVEQQRQALERYAADLEKTVDERTRELREADRAKDNFMALLAHELRNPLAPILNTVAMLRMHGGDDPLLCQSRELIERQVKHMARLIDDLLDVSRITCGKIELRKQPLELANIIDEAIQDLRPVFEESGQRLSVSMPDERMPLEADPTRLEQVFTNLLNNAAKYTEPGGKIWLDASVEGTDVAVKIRDSGIGISSEILPRIFDPFIQADQSLDRSQGGLGIGLTLVQRLVQMHGGSISAASEGLGRGSEFTVRLPLAEKRAGEPAPHSAAGSLNSKKLDRCAPTASKRILIIEDNEDSRRSLSLLLKWLGHEVEVAADGQEGVEKALRLRPQIVLVDIGLPGLSGYEVARQVRGNAEGNAMHLIALTGYGRPEDRRDALEAGFDEHLVKPIHLEQLAHVLE